MAILHRKEEKIQVVLGRLEKNYTAEQFVEMFIKLYSKEWGKIKSAYIKQSQDKEPGTIVAMPKPALYLEQLLEKYLAENPPVAVEKTTKDKVEKAPIEKKGSTKKATSTTAVKEEKSKTPTAKKASVKKETVTAETKEKPVRRKATSKD